MLLFGHVGLTAGAVRVWEMLTSTNRAHGSNELAASSKVAPPHLSGPVKSRIAIDYRLVLLGSLLPDIIDKPVWLVATRLNPEVSLSGRDYAHTLLFSLALLLTLVLLRYKKLSWLVLPLGSLMHVVFDQVWKSPAVLLWPWLGPLPKEETADWWGNLFRELFSHPDVYLPEIIGLTVILLLACDVIRKRNVIGFLKDGTIR
ncbi:MAG: metal-dependent hydrolase [Chloroflexota bacterium]